MSGAVLSKRLMAVSQKASFVGGCFSKLLFIFLLAALVGLGASAFLVTQPQDLSDLSTETATTKALPKRDLKAVLKSSLDRSFAVTLSEAELNQWLGRSLITKQSGVFEGRVTLDRVWVRLEDGRAEVIMARRFLGHPFTVSMYLQVERVEGMKGTSTEITLHGGPYLKDFPDPPKGGRFGKLVVPQGFLIFVMPAYEKLAARFNEEIELCFRDMARIKIEKGRLILNPQDPSAQLGLPQAF